MTTAQRPGLGAVLARPAYRRLFAAQMISRWGDSFITVALVVLVFRLTGSSLGVTGVVIAEIAPVLLLAPMAGAVIDRLPRVRVMIAATYGAWDGAEPRGSGWSSGWMGHRPSGRASRPGEWRGWGR